MIDAIKTNFNEPNHYPVDARAVAYTFAFVSLKRIGTGQFYLVSLKDKDGNPSRADARPRRRLRYR